MTFLTLKSAAAPLALLLALGLSACGKGEAEPAAAQAEAEHAEKEGAERVTISAEALETSGIIVSAASQGAVHETLELTGRIMLQPSARAEIHAPYPGPVRAVLRNVGDPVRRGEVLARIESAESLQTYSISAPIAGVVLERQTNIGDVSSDQPLFVVGDLSRVQGELNVSPRDIGRVAPGQSVLITSLDGATRIEARIDSVLPTADTRSQTLIARAPITIAANSPIRPGMAVRGAVVLSQQEVAVAVPRDAVQSYEGQSVVFVRIAEDSFEARPVVLGRSGRDTVEIISGLSAGETYVSTNAFLVKAELGKGAASHDD